MTKLDSKTVGLWDKFKISLGLLFDKQVPWFYKLIPFASVLYLIYPFDFISDLFPVLGQLDDLTIIGGALALFTKLAKQHQNNQQREQEKSNYKN